MGWKLFGLRKPHTRTTTVKRGGGFVTKRTPIKQSVVKYKKPRRTK